MPTPRSTHPAPSAGSMIFTATGYFLVEPDQSDVPGGYLLVRRPERPMAHPRLIRHSDIIAATAPATAATVVPAIAACPRVTSAAGAPALAY